jgi:hypothetical protein
MDDLEIKIAIDYTVPESQLSLNEIVRGLDENGNLIMRKVLAQVLAALEKCAQAEYPADRFIHNGHQSSPRHIQTPFGEVCYAMAQVIDRETRKTIQPLARHLQIPAYQRYSRDQMEAPLGQAVHLSYRLAAKETMRIRGQSPQKSTLWSWMQTLGAEQPWPSMKSMPFTFLMVDGTDIKKQGEQGAAAGTMQMRWAWAAEKPGKPFQIVGFWVGKDWSEIRRDLEQRLDYSRLRMLFADGELGIPSALMTDQMQLQRCVWHGIRDFRFILYQDEIGGAAQTPLRQAMKANPLFYLKKADLETFTPEDEAKVREKLTAIQKAFDELLALLPEETHPKSRHYVSNFMRSGVTALEYWLTHKEWPPLTTNQAEYGFSRVVNRIKRVGRRWSDQGLLNWLTLAIRKIFEPANWSRLWRSYSQFHKGLGLRALNVTYQWIPCIT